jgi:hypothetical protein
MRTSHLGQTLTTTRRYNLSLLIASRVTVTRTWRMQKNVPFDESNGGFGESFPPHGLGLIKKPTKIKQSPHNMIVMLGTAQRGKVLHES